jgi:phosphoribosyl 1,2-cyclic phosphodiesterase
MNVRFWGVRGSIPVPGPRTERYGGNTSCVEVTTAAGTHLVFDAGTGLRNLGRALMNPALPFEAGRGTAHVLISHTHWDHIHGLPFFAPLHRKGNQVHLYARERCGPPLRAIFSSGLSPGPGVAPPAADSPISAPSPHTPQPYFPVPIERPAANLAINELRDDARFEIADVRVACARLNHPYTAIAYALEADGAKVVYVSDTAPFGDILFGQEYVPGPPPPGAELPPAAREALRAMRADVVRLCEGADLVIYDTMFTPGDYAQAPHYGHSRPSDALAICQDAGARTLALFHHAPERTDDEVDRMLVDTRVLATGQKSVVAVIAAYEGLDLQLGQRA